MDYRIQYIKTGIKDEEENDLYRIVCNEVEIDVTTLRGIKEYYPEWSIKLFPILLKISRGFWSFIQKLLNPVIN